MAKETNKPLIESLINSTAVALFAGGVVLLNAERYFGFAMIVLGVAIEWFKYWGRRTYW